MKGRLENLLGALVLALGDQVREATELAAGLGSSAPAALTSLHHRPGQSIEVLRNRLALSHSAGVRLVDRLAGEGLVVRQPGADNREVGLALTSQGARRAQRVHQARRAVLSRALVGLTELDRRDLENLLEDLLRTQVAVRADPGPVCRLCERSACPLRRCPNPAGR